MQGSSVVVENLPPGYSAGDSSAAAAVTKEAEANRASEPANPASQPAVTQRKEQASEGPPAYHSGQISPNGQMVAATSLVIQEERDWSQPFCGCLNNVNIALVTCCCLPFTRFLVAYYSRKMLYWLGIVSCAAVVFVLWLVRAMVLTGLDGWSRCYSHYRRDYYYENHCIYSHAWFEFWFFWLFMFLTIAVLAVRQLMAAMLRYKLRTDRKIRGHMLEDIAVGCCCEHLGTCQMMAEVDREMALQGRNTLLSRQ